MLQVPWSADPHTKIKHAVYRQYLSKWMPIMMQGWGGNITYAEGFAGPGVYLDGSPGSPVIALRSLLDDSALRTSGRRIRLLFVDREPRCTRMLQDQLTVAATPVPVSDLPKYGIDVDIMTGNCDPCLEELLTRRQAWGRPMLVVLDTWGASVPLDLIRRVAANGHSEVIVTIQPQYFARFAESSDIAHGDKVFGGTDWRAVAAQPPGSKARWLLQHYRETVRTVGFSHVLDFELVDRRGQALYLVFGTTHEKGLRKMKEAMWEVDDVTGVGYRDPRDPDQETLNIEFEPQTAPLRRLLVDYMLALPKRQAAVHQLRHFALFQTVYKESQVKPVVEEMIGRKILLRLSGDGRLSFGDVVRLP